MRRFFELTEHDTALLECCLAHAAAVDGYAATTIGGRRTALRGFLAWLDAEAVELGAVDVEVLHRYLFDEDLRAAIDLAIVHRLLGQANLETTASYLKSRVLRLMSVDLRAAIDRTAPLDLSGREATCQRANESSFETGTQSTDVRWICRARPVSSLQWCAAAGSTKSLPWPSSPTSGANSRTSSSRPVVTFQIVHRLGSPSEDGRTGREPSDGAERRSPMKRFARWLTVRRRAAAVLSVADPTTGSDRTDALLQIRATAPLLYWAQAVAAQFALVSPVNWVYGSRAHVEGLAEPQRARARVRRARFIDRYIVAALVVSLVLLFGLWVGRTSFAASERVEMAWVLLGLSLVGLRVTDILQAATNMVLFDPIRNPTSPLSYTSVSRTFVNSAFNFLELILAGAFVYLALGDRFRPRIETPIDAVEQAIGVQFAFGLNSVGTTSGARVFVMGHLLVAFVFIILVLGRWITALPGGAR